jgi:hypothetical protein
LLNFGCTLKYCALYREWHCEQKIIGIEMEEGHLHGLKFKAFHLKISTMSLSHYWPIILLATFRRGGGQAMDQITSSDQDRVDS